MGALAVLGAVLGAPALAAPDPAIVTFSDNRFTPRKPAPTRVNNTTDGPNQEGVWLRAMESGGTHNIRENRRLFRSGSPSASLLEYQEDISAGTYHYYCEVHGSRRGGMDGLIRVRPAATNLSTGTARIHWADAEAEPNHRFRVEFRRKGGRWRLWRGGTKRPSALFGRNDKPVDARPNRTYQVRARTFVRGQPRRSSRWSPRIGFNLPVDPDKRSPG